MLPFNFKRQILGKFSSESVPNSLWECQDVQLGAGVVIIQPETQKVVILSDKYTDLVPTGKKVARQIAITTPTPTLHPNPHPNSSTNLQFTSPETSKRNWNSSFVRGFTDLSLRADGWFGGTVPDQRTPVAQTILEDEYKEVERTRWFLPKGRKDIDEPLEGTAIREGYEESGYRCTLFPLPIPSTSPVPGASSGRKEEDFNTEPIFVSTQYMPPNTKRTHGVEYITFWYIAHIPPDAIREENTGMADEVNYESHLLSFEEAMGKLNHEQRKVVRMSWHIWQHSLAVEQGKLTREPLQSSGVATPGLPTPLPLLPSIS